MLIAGAVRWRKVTGPDRGDGLKKIELRKHDEKAISIPAADRFPTPRALRHRRPVIQGFRL